MRFIIGEIDSFVFVLNISKESKMLFHLFEFLGDRYIRTTFNHNLDHGNLVLHTRSSLTVRPSARPTDVIIECDSTTYFMTIGYVYVIEISDKYVCTL